MYSNLPRHTFGYIQSKLFPKYFQTGSILMTVVISTFLLEHSEWNWKAKLQVRAHVILICCYGDIGREDYY